MCVVVSVYCHLLLCLETADNRLAAMGRGNDLCVDLASGPARQVATVHSVLRTGKTDVADEQHAPDRGEDSDDQGTEHQSVHDVLVRLDSTKTDGVIRGVKGDIGNGAKELGEESLVGRGHVLGQLARHVGGPDTGGDGGSDRVADFGDEQDHGGHSGDVDMGDRGLRGDLDGGSSETASETLEHLAHDERGRVAVGSSSVEHDSDTEQADEQTGEEEVLETLGRVHDGATGNAEDGECERLGRGEVGEVAVRPALGHVDV